MLFGIRIQFSINTLKTHFDYRNNILVQNFVKIDILTRLVHKDLPCCIKAKLIALLELSIIRIILLYCIISQMHKGLIYALLTQGEPMWACSDIPLFEQVTLLVFKVDAVHKYPQSDVELATVD